MSHSPKTCLLAAVTLLAAASVASAQTSRPPLPLSLGQMVWVTTSEGLDMKGVVSAITPTTLEVSGEAGTRQFVVAETRRIAKRDGNWNGFWIGAGVGFLPFAIEAVGGENNCADKMFCSSSGQLMAAAVFSGGLWGGIGALIDNAIEGRQTIYTGPSTGLQLTPVVTRSGVGVRGSVRW